MLSSFEILSDLKKKGNGEEKLEEEEEEEKEEEEEGKEGEEDRMI